MTNIKEVLRLYLTGDYSQRDIATALSMSRNTIKKCIERYKELNLSAYEVANKSNSELYEIMFRKEEKSRVCPYYIPDFEELAKDLKKPHITKKLLWKEYVDSCQDSGLKPYSISQFNALLDEYLSSHNLSLRRDREPGEVLELDWSGSFIPLHSPFSEETIPCHLFVAALPFSSYFYAEAFADEKIKSWITGIVHSLEFIGGVPKILKPDNCKTATIKADKYEPELNQAMIELAEYYKTAVIPARVRKPRDKNVVEAAVGFATRNIIAALRNQIFYSIDEMNAEIQKKVKELNDTKFAKKDGSRTELFLAMEKSTLLPLPLKPFQLYERTTVKVAPDYHVKFAEGSYSVHPKHIGEELFLKASCNEVFIYTKDGKDELARHKRCLFKGQKRTDPAHIPPAHQEVLGWSGDKFRSEARYVGPNTELLIENVLKSREYEVQAYSACRGILSLKNKYGKSNLEAVAQDAVASHIVSYKSIKALLEMYIDSKNAEEALSDDFDPNDFFITHDDVKTHSKEDY